MDTISSAEFRKTYAKLTQPTVVTVNGHPIGRWTPTTTPTIYISRAEVQAVLDAGLASGEITPDAHAAISVLDQPFSSRPFTPAPKPGRR